MIISGTFKKCWKNKAKFVALFAVLCILVSGVLYPLLNVSKPDRRQSEMMGLPMSIIGNVVKENPEALDDEAKEFVYSIAPPEQWEEYHDRSGWNQIKFNGLSDVSPIDDESALKILKITAKCFIVAPEAAFDELLKMTDIVWTVSAENSYWAIVTPAIDENDMGIHYQGIGIIKSLQSLLNQMFLKSWLAYPCWCTGFHMLLLLIFMVAKCKRVGDIKRIALCVPLFIYNFGTMLLLSGPDFRFFYYTFMVSPLLIFSLLIKRDDNYASSLNLVK